MMQVAVEDTHADYLICRGYDPYTKRFFDYEESDPDKLGIPVAKPYSSRAVGTYAVGQIFPAVMPLTKIGRTPGVAETSDGHPADLDEAIGILYTDDNLVVQWLLLESGGSSSRLFELKTGQSLVPGGTATALLLYWDGDSWETDSDVEFTIRDMMSKFRQSSPPSGQNGARGFCELYGGEWVIKDMQHQARKIHFVVNDATGFAITDSTATVDGVDYQNGYTPTTGITTVYNKSISSNYLYEGDDDDKGTAYYDLTNNKYWIDMMECP
jgi:hypothetical protein